MATPEDSSVHTPRYLAALLLAAIPFGGCGGPDPGPSPTPPGQSAPGEPGPDGLPRLPSAGAKP